MQHQNHPQSLANKEKLKLKKDIDELFQNGKVLNQYPIQMIYILHRSENSKIQAGFSVPKKKIKKASDRNKIKRLMRESYRKNKTVIKKPIYLKNFTLKLMFIYKDKKKQSYHEIEQKIFILLQRLQNIAENKTSA